MRKSSSAGVGRMISSGENGFKVSRSVESVLEVAIGGVDGDGEVNFGGLL